MGKHIGKKRRDRIKKVKEVEGYTTTEVAKIFNVHQQTVIKWCQRGVLACHRIGLKGSHRRILKEDVQRMINERIEYFEPKKTVQIPSSVIPLLDNQLRIWNQQATQARADGKHQLADKIDGWCEGMNVSRRIVERSIVEPELSKYREDGVDYFL